MKLAEIGRRDLVSANGAVQVTDMAMPRIALNAGRPAEPLYRYICIYYTLMPINQWSSYVKAKPNPNPTAAIRHFGERTLTSLPADAERSIGWVLDT